MTQGSLGLVVFALAVIAGTLFDHTAGSAADGDILVADLHVHPAPGDGALLPHLLAREARGRGLDVIVLTGHNNQVGVRIAGWLPSGSKDVLVIPGQEVTSPRFHLIAAGVRSEIDWRLDAVSAISEIHRTGGAAIAAHPNTDSWEPRDPQTLALLDGAEVAHASRAGRPDIARGLDAFFDAARRVNPDISPVGSSDFHMAAPIGRSRTYLFVSERTEGGVIRAVREGATVAEDPGGVLTGRADRVQRIEAFRADRVRTGAVSTAEKACALAALAGLALLATAGIRQ